MAAFKNQFSQQSPFDLPLRPEFFGWPSQIAIEAKAIISTSDIAWLTAVGNQLERVISKAVAAPSPTAIGRLMSMPYFAAMFDDAMTIGRSTFRDMYGDFNLLMEGHDAHDWDAELVKSTKTDRLLVFCLWKLVDAEAALGPLGGTGDMERGGAYTVEAMRALQSAQMILMQMNIATNRSNQSNAVKTKNAKKNRADALAMANSMYFQDIEDAADYVAARIPKSTNAKGMQSTYTAGYMVRILQQEGWQPWKSPDSRY